MRAPRCDWVHLVRCAISPIWGDRCSRGPRWEGILAEELASLSTAEVASSALDGGYVIVVEDLDEAVELCDRIAPEHLALHV
ncbi:MAG: histidinol dehydrogenase, partial [Acidobacteria bacterium]|nr:histidinol dehydrogenase [Acidobacteriota bacterium]